MSNLQTRIVSAVVLAAAVLALTWVGGWPFRVLSGVICIAIFFEWEAMAAGREARAWSEGGLGVVPQLLILVFAVGLTMALPAVALLALAAVATAVLALLSAWRGRSQWLAAGFAYAALSGLSIGLLRGDDRAGLHAIVFLFAVVWATDILAYFVGRAIGGPKLAPSISPGKTWSGAFGGAMAGLVAGVAAAYAAGAPSLVLLGAAALVLSIVSQAGDLFESWVKRRHGVKDSGWIIPGHGGVMDRVDGLVVAALALYLVGSLAGGGLDWPARGLFPG
jgi:phosphatidate cytidylyltransferase